MATYDELDAALTRVAAEKADAVADVVRVVRQGDRTPREAIRVLNGWYLRQQATDAGVRAVPGRVGGVVSSLRPEPMASADRTMVYLLALGQIHGVDLDDPERRKALLVAVLLGDEGARLAGSAVAGSAVAQGGAWARRLVALPRAGNPLVAQLLSAAVHSGIAVALGAGGESIKAQAVVAQAARAFGTPPAAFPDQDAPAAPPVSRRTHMGAAADEPITTSGAYARALARTLNKMKKGDRP